VRRPSAGTVGLAWVVLRVLERFGRGRADAAGTGAGRRRRGRRRGSRRAAPAEPLAPPRGRLVTAMLVFLVVALVAMIGFEYAITRLIGVLCIFGFIICGVFAVADPRFLTVEEEGPVPAAGERG
jgi:hypothetical protein